MISIIIPTRNRPAHLRKCLSAINDQSNLAYLDKIYIANDGDIPIKASEFYLLHNIIDIIIIVETYHIGPAGARNKAIKLVKSKYVAFLDDDSYPSNEWLNKCLEQFRNCPAIIAQLGKIEWSNSKISYNFKESFIPKLRQKIYDNRDLIFSDPVFIRETCKTLNKVTPIGIHGISTHLSGGNFAILNSFFVKHGGFNTKYFTYHDKELAHRVMNNGGLIAYNSKMVVKHDHDPSIIRSLKRSFFAEKYKLLFKEEYSTCNWVKQNQWFISPRKSNFILSERLFIFVQKVLQITANRYFVVLGGIKD